MQCHIAICYSLSSGCSCSSTELSTRKLTLVFAGPRIVTVDAGDCFNLNANKFKMRFASDNKVHGMLRACSESRQIMLRLLPIRLPSKYWKKELRIGHHDVSLKYSREFPLLGIVQSRSFGERCSSFRNILPR